MNLPSVQVQKRVLTRILQVSRIQPRAIPVLKLLFRQTMEAAERNTDAKGIKVLQILERCKEEGGPHGEGSTRNTLTHLRKVLKDFFLRDEYGLRTFFTVEIDGSTPVLRFNQRKLAGERVRKFWKSYFATFAPSCLYYPASQFFRHRNGSYLRNPRTDWREQKAFVEELFELNSDDLRPSHSFIASGMTSAIIRVFGCFFRDDALLKAKALKPTDVFISWDHEAIIVLGSPTTSIDLIERIEKDLPYRTITDRKGATEFRHPHLPPYIDDDEGLYFNQEHVPIKKHVLVTRKIEHRAEGTENCEPQTRVVTLLSGHSRSIEAVTNILTSEPSMREVLHMFHGKVPREFQIVLEVDFETSYIGLNLKNTRVLYAKAWSRKSKRQG